MRTFYRALAAGILSPLWGLIVYDSHPGLTPWAVFLRRFAAGVGQPPGR
jgi:hypothetical protein